MVVIMRKRGKAWKGTSPRIELWGGGEVEIGNRGLDWSGRWKGETTSSEESRDHRIRASEEAVIDRLPCYVV